jgi:hypothetical protein
MSNIGNAHIHYLPSGLRLVRQMVSDGYTFAGSPTGEYKLFGHNTERMLAHWSGYVQTARNTDEAKAEGRSND